MMRQSLDSGLFVPEALSRERQVWTRDEWKLLNRATTLLTAKGIRAYLRCENPRCHAAPIEKIWKDDGFVLRCSCRERVFTRGF